MFKERFKKLDKGIIIVKVIFLNRIINKVEKKSNQ